MTNQPDIVPDQATAEESTEFATDMAIAARNARFDRTLFMGLRRRACDVDESEYGEPEGWEE